MQHPTTAAQLEESFASTSLNAQPSAAEESKSEHNPKDFDAGH